MASPITFFDCETTGLSSDDRMVSLGVIHFDDEDALKDGRPPDRALHLIFNPGRPSHPRARKVHGYNDELLAQQDEFRSHASEVARFFRKGHAAVAHNVSFDRRFIVTALVEADAGLPQADFSCTMLAHRRLRGSPSGLDAVTLQAGLPQRQGRHGALADAWYSMAIYNWLNDWPLPPSSTLPVGTPVNLRLGSAEDSSHRPIVSNAPVALRAAAAPAAYLAARSAMLPVATILMAIAHADGDVLTQEVEVISLLMHTVLAGSDRMTTDAQEQDLLAELVDLRPSAADLDNAAEAIIASQHWRNTISGWVKTVTLADGSGSSAEQAVILDIAERLRRARQRLAR